MQMNWQVLSSWLLSKWGEEGGATIARRDAAYLPVHWRIAGDFLEMRLGTVTAAVKVVSEQRYSQMGHCRCVIQRPFL
jgi:hypothetical protein